MQRKSEENFWGKQNQKFFKLENCRCEQENIELKEVKSSGETKKKRKGKFEKEKLPDENKKMWPQNCGFYAFSFV